MGRIQGFATILFPPKDLLDSGDRNTSRAGNLKEFIYKIAFPDPGIFVEFHGLPQIHHVPSKGIGQSL